MPSYCSVTDLKTYLGVTPSGDDVLIQLMLDAATNRIDSFTGRTFQAAADETRYFDPTESVDDGMLNLDADLSYITSVINGDGTDIVNYVYPRPRNLTPYYQLGIRSSAPYQWEISATDTQDSIDITGRWAWMDRANITALARTTNVVTATVKAPRVSVGASVFIVGCADTSFNGTFTVVSNTGSAITWAQTAANDTDTTATLLHTPTDIVAACRRLGAWAYRQKDTQQGDSDRPILVGDGTIIMPSTLPADVTSLLRAYVKRM